MIKDTLKFALKLMLIFAAVVVFTLIGLSIILSVQISTPLKLVAGGAFMLFEAGLLWDNCGRWGEKDCRAVITYVRGRGSREQLEKARAELYHPFKGFAAGIIAMLIPAVLTVVCTALAFNGWEKHCASLTDTLYNILYMLFMSASPLLLLLSPVDANAVFFYGMPTRASFGYFGAAGTVTPYLFFIPILLFIAVSGVCYIIGFKKRASEVPENMQTHYFPKDHRYKMLPQDESENAPAGEPLDYAHDTPAAAQDTAARQDDTQQAAAQPETEEKP